MSLKLVGEFDSTRGVAMGAWDVGALDNDDAQDFLAEWQEGEDYEPVDELLSEVLDMADSYLEADIAARAVAAGAVLSAVVNETIEELFDDDEDSIDWAFGLPQPKVVLLNKLVRALKRILKDESELREQWEETDDFTAWRASVTEVIADLT